MLEKQANLTDVQEISERIMKMGFPSIPTLDQKTKGGKKVFMTLGPTKCENKKNEN